MGTVIGFVFLGQAPSLATNLSLVPIVGGVVHAAAKPGVAFDVTGLASAPARAALASTVCFAFAKVLAKKQMTSAVKKERGLTAANNYALLTCCSCACLAVPSYALDGARARADSTLNSDCARTRTGRFGKLRDEKLR